jgi:vancomycin resistance protein VanW
MTYRISQEKEILRRHVRNALDGTRVAKVKSREALPVRIIAHQSLIRRQLRGADMALQENKAVNLGIAAPLVDGVLVRPGETFSFWGLVGRASARKGYLDGLVIRSNGPDSGVGGGMCQFTNLLHWMVLHSDLDIVEHHHHNAYDLFPDYQRAIPFGCGTSICYNYLDYRFQNNTDMAYQVLVRVDGEYLSGELRAERPLAVRVHIREEDACFSQEDGVVFRNNKIFRKVVDKKTGNTLENRLLLENHAKVMYDLDPSAT